MNIRMKKYECPYGKLSDADVLQRRDEIEALFVRLIHLEIQQARKAEATEGDRPRFVQIGGS